MTAAHLGRRRTRAPRRSSAPRPATPRPRWRRTPRRPASRRSCWCPEGKIAAGKLAQAILHGAQVIMVRGNFDDCLRAGPRARLGLPGRAGQLGQPGPAPGPEDRVVRDRRLPRRRPRLPPAAGRQRRQHLGVLARLPRVLRPRAGHPQARGCAASRPRARRRWSPASRSPTRRPGPPRSGSATPPRGSSPRRPPHESDGRFRAVTDDQILAAQRELAVAATASSSSRPRPPASPGCSPTWPRATRTPAARSSSP